jgi:hypothetical protein
MPIRFAQLLMWLLLASPVFATSIQSTDTCTATLGLPTCFPHDGLVDWGVTPGLGQMAISGFSGAVQASLVFPSPFPGQPRFLV